MAKKRGKKEKAVKRAKKQVQKQQEPVYLETYDVKRKTPVWAWIVLGIVIIAFFWVIIAFGFNNQKTGDSLTFSIGPNAYWYLCLDKASDMSVEYEMTSNSALNIYFVDDRAKLQDLNSGKPFSNYLSCYVPSVLAYSGQCTINGQGCFILDNSQNNSAVLSLSYSYKKG